MPTTRRLPKRLITALPLLVLLTLIAGLAVRHPDPVEAGHLCGGTGSPFGPFDFQTYEDVNHKTTYARTIELAGFNQLFHDRVGFHQPFQEVGPRSAGSGQTQLPYIPPVLLKSIAWIESGWNQAAGSVPYGQVGPTLTSHDCGYGIMQVTSGMQNVSGVPNLDQAMIGGHYAFNIARGARILAEKWNNAPEFRPIVGDRNPSIIENWYYALWGYNGFAFKNHPYAHDTNRPPYRCDGTQPRGNYPYQELVLGCVANPPSRGGTRLWEPQPVTLPNLSDPAFAGPLNPAHWDACSQQLQCAAMDLPTPSPWHTDPTGPAASREQVLGYPGLALSTGIINLAAVPGGQSLPADLTIANSGTGVSAWRAFPTASWLKVSRLQGVSLGGDLGSTSQTVKVNANAAGLPPGTYTSEILVESLYSAGVPTRVTVSLRVDPQAGVTIPGDFTGDGKTDLAFLCCSDYLSMWISVGNGSFSKTVYRPWPGYGMSLGSWQPGHFNNDGRLDLLHLCCDG